MEKVEKKVAIIKRGMIPQDQASMNLQRKVRHQVIQWERKRLTELHSYHRDQAHMKTSQAQSKTDLEMSNLAKHLDQD